MHAAGRAGVARIGVLTGGIGAAELRLAGAAAIYDDPAHVLARLHELTVCDPVIVDKAATGVREAPKSGRRAS